MMISTGALILLDTNILVHLLRGSVIGQRLVVDYDLFNRPSRPLISFVTVGEMYALARKRGWETKRRQTLEMLLKELVVVNIHQPGIVEVYAEIDYFSEKVVKPACQMGKNDMWIAATVASLDVWLLTTDTDFDHLHGRYIKRAKIDVKTGETLN